MPETIVAKKSKQELKRKKRKSPYEIQKEHMDEILRKNLKWADRMKFPEIQTPEECAERLDFFFNYCSQTGDYPTVEKMCLALGGYSAKVRDWEVNGTKGWAISEMIKSAKQVIAAIDAELAATNNLPQVLYIFRAKNFYGLKDSHTNEVVRTSEPEVNEKAIAERYNIIDVIPEKHDKKETEIKRK